MENIQKQLELINQQIKELASIYKLSLVKFNISENEFWIWYALIIMNEKCTQQDIVNNWFISKQTVNTIIKNLVKNNYITLKTMPNNHNKKIICLTKKGRDYGEKIVLPMSSMELKAFGKLTLEDRKKLIEIMSKYIQILKDEAQN